MDKRLILAVAGSGKTTYIINQLNEEEPTLIIAYTIINTENIRVKIIVKFGYFPSNIKLLTYFSFLYNFCFKPFLSSHVNSKGLSWKFPPVFTMNFRLTDIKRYMSQDNRLYHNRLAKLLEIKQVTPGIIQRLEKYYNKVYIDEVQDFAGHDFNLLSKLLSANVNFTIVGDFYQHTFDTSSDGNVNRSLHDNFEEYVRRFEQVGVVIDDQKLLHSHRCSQTTCDYIRQKIGIQIYSHNNLQTEIKEIVGQPEVDVIIANDQIIKLFYQDSHKYKCRAINWGACKGEDSYNDICIILNSKPLTHFRNNTLNQLAPQTKNKFYVACSRARGNIYFVSYELVKKFKS